MGHVGDAKAAGSFHSHAAKFVFPGTGRSAIPRICNDDRFLTIRRQRCAHDGQGMALDEIAEFHMKIQGLGSDTASPITAAAIYRELRGEGRRSRLVEKRQGNDREDSGGGALPQCHFRYGQS